MKAILLKGTLSATVEVSVRSPKHIDHFRKSVFPLHPGVGNEPTPIDIEQGDSTNDEKSQQVLLMTPTILTSIGLMTRAKNCDSKQHRMSGTENAYVVVVSFKAHT